MQRLLKTIGAVSILSLTLLPTAVEAQHQAESAKTLSDVALCFDALNSERSEWNKNPVYSYFVTEAIRRALSITKCRQRLSCSGILASPAMQKFAATALTQTKQEVNTSFNATWDSGKVVESVRQNLLRLINTNVSPPTYGPRGPGPQIVDHGLAAMLTATKSITIDQFISCFPQAWQFAFTTLLAQRELLQRQEKAGQEAKIEAAKPINRLRQAYFSYMVVKKCHDVRLGYQLVYINEVEFERSRLAVNAIETSALNEDSSIDTSNTWQEAIRMIGASKQYVEQYFCQKTYNDLLNAAPYSPPVKDFGIQRY
jgi:hypothetical protein